PRSSLFCTSTLRSFSPSSSALTDDKFIPNFVIERFDLEGFRDAHSFLASEFKAMHGCSLDGFLRCLWGICNIGMIPPRVAQAMAENEQLGQEVFANETLNRSEERRVGK